MGSGGLSLNANPKLVNDTLANLLEIEFRTDSLTEQKAQQNFETLRRFGFHQSAYNLLFETYKYQDLKWNKDTLATSLKQSDKFIYPWFQDKTKWRQKEAQPITGVWQKSGFSAQMKFCASYQVQCWQTVWCFEIRFFAKRQNVIANGRTTVPTTNDRAKFKQQNKDKPFWQVTNIQTIL